MLIGKYLPNGAEVLKVSYSVLTNEGVVLAKLEKAMFHQYVTWRFNGTDLSSTHTGNYFGSPCSNSYDDLLEAQNDFRARS